MLFCVFIILIINYFIIHYHGNTLYNVYQVLYSMYMHTQKLESVYQFWPPLHNKNKNRKKAFYYTKGEKAREGCGKCVVHFPLS